MKLKLIPIGNSRGIRIPKAMLKQCGPADEIEVEVRGNTLILRSGEPVRRGWDKAFAKMRARGDDRLIFS